MLGCGILVMWYVGDVKYFGCGMLGCGMFGMWDMGHLLRCWMPVYKMSLIYCFVFIAIRLLLMQTDTCALLKCALSYL